MRRFLPSLFQSETQSTRTQLGLQSLESREVPASVQLQLVSANNFTLFVNGDTAGEVIELRSSASNRTEVISNGQVIAPFTDVPIRTVMVNGNDLADDAVISGTQSGVTNRVNVYNFDEVTVGAINKSGTFSLASIRSEVSVGVNANSELNILGDADTTGKNVLVQQNAVFGLAPVPVRFNLASGIKTELTMRTGAGNDTVTIDGTFSGGAIGLRVSTNGGQDTFNVERNSTILRLNGGDGNDTFNIAPAAHHLGNVDKMLILNGELGTNSLVVHDENRGLSQTTYDATFSVEPQGNRLTVNQLNLQSGETDSAVVAYNAMQSIRFLAPTAAGASEIDVLATPEGVDTVIESGRASEVRVGGGRMDGIEGNVTVNRTDFGGRLILDDTAETEFRTTRLNANSVDASAGLVSFDDNTKFVDLRLGSGLDYVITEAYRTGGGRYVVDTGEGGVLQGVDTGNNWAISGPGQGSVNGSSLEFQNVEVLQGGDGNDHFRFVTEAASILNIHDNSPDPNSFDTIDYSLLGTAVDVDLTAERGSRVGTNLSGQLTGIEAVFGSQANDLLTGSAGANVLLGVGGDDTIAGGGGRDILVGGTGADDLSNGNFETIYVAGNATNFTTFQWESLRKEWTRTDATYQNRVNHIRNGGGFNGGTVLNGATIANDNAPDIVRAGAALDLIFRHGADVLDPNRPQTPGEIVNM